MMKCPTPCICGLLVELHEMHEIEGKLPDGGNLVCQDCYCERCEGTGECMECDGLGDCHCCGACCVSCDGFGDCVYCKGKGYSVSKEAT
jgi:hypothetical protein